MSANEIANHIEASAWLRFGPGADPLIQPPNLYWRSQSGFLDRIGVADVADPTAFPFCYVQLDRYYTREETAIFAFIPTTADLDPTGVGFIRPDISSGQIPVNPFVIPVDSRLIYAEVPAPMSDAEAIQYFETFNGFIIAPTAILFSGEDPAAIAPSFFDVCIQLVRVPRSNTGPTTVSYKQILNFF